MISPCITLLRQLSTKINRDLGSAQGLKHTSPDVWRDITTIMGSLQANQVYLIEDGRKILGEKCEVPNVISDGVNNIEKPLGEYNKEFKKQQLRRRRHPLIGEPAAVHPPCATPEGPVEPPPPPQTAGDTPPPSATADDATAVEIQVEQEPGDPEIRIEEDPEAELLRRESEEDVELDMD